MTFARSMRNSNTNLGGARSRNIVDGFGNGYENRVRAGGAIDTACTNITHRFAVPGRAKYVQGAFEISKTT
jgi:hypothetical protein